MTTETSTTMRRCIGSTRFGIEAHEADARAFPVQPSQKDGLGRMCKRHWRAYTNALRKAAVARMAAEADAAPTEPTPEPVAEPEVRPEPVAEPDLAPEPVPEATVEPEASTPRRTRRAMTSAELAVTG